MLYAYEIKGSCLAPLGPDRPLTDAVWVDLYRPLDRQVQQATMLGVEIPTLADMEEIEISNRLYREGPVSYMTAVLPGQLPDGRTAGMPVTFILTPERLITVRHHAPRPFETFPTRADRATLPLSSPDTVMLGLMEEIIARLADIAESAGRVLDEVGSRVFGGTAPDKANMLQATVEHIGREAELMARVRLGLLTMERILAFYTMGLESRGEGQRLRTVAKALNRDIQALEVHADFLASRVGLTLDATMGMINLRQNETVRVLSVVAALFLPPTLIASIYGMNFDKMPELHWDFGYPYSLGLMLASAVGTWLFLRYKNWL